ncbi:MAG: hypothetical protein KA247_05690 [Bacteroidetes bacterium]|nr:hypothetical protein [Bacteroidota bacterium]
MLKFDNTFDVESEYYVPHIPEYLSASLVSDSVISVSWSGITDSPEHYILQRRSQHQSSFATIAVLTKDMLEQLGTKENIRQYYRFLDKMPMKSDTVYYYRISAGTAYRTSAFSSATTIQMTLTPPSEISISGTSTSVSFHWTMRNNFPVYTAIERKDSLSAYSEIARIYSAYTTYTDSLLDPAKKYSYRFSTVTDNNRVYAPGKYSISYDLGSTTISRQITTDENPVEMIVTKDRSTIIVIGYNGSVRAYDYFTGNMITSFQTTTNGMPPNTSALNSSNTLLAISMRNIVKIYSFPDGVLKRTIDAGDNHFGLAVSSTPGSKILATVNYSDYQHVKLWNIETGDSLYTFPELTNNALDLWISPDDSRLIVGGDSITVWDLNTRTKISTIPNFELILNPYFVSSNEIYLANRSTIVESISNSPAKSMQFLAHSSQNHIAFNADGTMMAVADYDGSWLYDLRTPFIPAKLNGLYGWNKRIYFSADGKTVFGLGQSGTINFWKMYYRWRSVN